MSEKAAVFRNLLAPILLALTGIVVTLLISAKVDHTQKSMVTAELRANQMHWVGLMEFSTEKEITLAQTLVSVFEDTPVIAFPRVFGMPLFRWNGCTTSKK